MSQVGVLACGHKLIYVKVYNNSFHPELVLNSSDGIVKNQPLTWPSSWRDLVVDCRLNIKSR